MLAALRRSGAGRARPTAWSGVLIVAMLVAGAVTSAAAALSDDARPAVSTLANDERPAVSTRADHKRPAAERSAAAPPATTAGSAATSPAGSTAAHGSPAGFAAAHGSPAGSAAAHGGEPVVPRPARQHVVLPPGADLHGVLRSTRLVITGVEVDTDMAVAAALAVTGLPVPAVVAHGLLRIAAGTGPLVSARHLQGHLRA